METAHQESVNDRFKRHRALFQNWTLNHVVIHLILMSRMSTANVCYLGHSGLLYTGTVNRTKSGTICQFWASNSPHPVHTQIKDQNFPDGSKIAAKNYCRSPLPDLRQDGPWCYTTVHDIEWDYCNPCPGNLKDYNACSLPDQGTSYKGKVNISRGGFKCDYWIKFQNKSFKFPDANEDTVRNYCRNPDILSYAGPWCFTVDEKQKWDYCDVCAPFYGSFAVQGSVTTVFKEQLFQALSLGSCRHWCISHLSCIYVVYEEQTKRCWWSPYPDDPLKLTDDNFELHRISRQCPAWAKATGYYLTEYPNSLMDSGSLIAAKSVWKECEEACIKETSCIIFEMTSHTDSCWHHKDYFNQHNPDNSGLEKFVSRCNTSEAELAEDASMKLMTEVKQPEKTLPLTLPFVSLAGRFQKTEASFIGNDDDDNKHSFVRFTTYNPIGMNDYVQLEAITTQDTSSPARAINVCIVLTTFVLIGSTVLPPLIAWKKQMKQMQFRNKSQKAVKTTNAEGRIAKNLAKIRKKTKGIGAKKKPNYN